MITEAGKSTGSTGRRSPRYAIISDVHSNLHALKEVLMDLDREGAETIFCAGDLVGYGAFPNEVVSLLRERQAVCISGNHDRSVVSLDTSKMNEMAAKAISWTAARISEESLTFLKGLNTRIKMDLAGRTAAMFHGSPRNDDEYLWERLANAEILGLAGAQIVICGHTHRPYIKRFPGGTLVNPGSVGQPRDGDSRACYAIYDPRKHGFQIKRVVYPAREAAEAIIAAGLPKDLGMRLLTEDFN